MDKKEAKIEEILTRGVEEIKDSVHLKKALSSGKKLRIKHGIDPTGPRIHIGRASILWKLRAFQEMGHTVVLIIGDFTAKIGDASDKQTMRKPLSEKEIEENKKNYPFSIAKILDINKTELRYNSEWLDSIKLREMVGLAAHFTAQQMIQRRNFKERWEEGKPVGVHEMLYPLFQGYDSIATRADLEVGGSDQLFNLLIGRDIQKIYKQSPQDVMTLSMVTGLDGRKMSTTWGNVVYIDDLPQEQFGKIMSLKDDLIGDYLRFTTNIPLSEVEDVQKKLTANKINPLDVKNILAKALVGMYHGEKAAELAAEEFSSVFKDRKLPTIIPEVKIKKRKINIIDLLIQTEGVKSKSEARRLIKQGGVKVDGILRDDPYQDVIIQKGAVLQIGKRRFVRIV